MSAPRPAPMVSLPRCRVRPVVRERLNALVVRLGLPVCDVIRLVVEAGLGAMERELTDRDREDQS